MDLDEQELEKYKKMKEEQNAKSIEGSDISGKSD